MQRVSNASVTVDGIIIASIGPGLLLLVGIENADDKSDIGWLCSKIASLRIFQDGDGKMNLSVKQTEGDILVVSQFTLHASVSKGMRPSFTGSARPEMAIPLYEHFIQTMEMEIRKPVKQGKFGAHMEITLTNEGPVTILLDSKRRD